MRTLYFDCFAGASGNMILGALIALGVDRDELCERLKKLSISNFDLHVSEVDRSGIKALHVEVRTPEEPRPRHLNDIITILEKSELSRGVQGRSIAIFRRLARAEAKIHGMDVAKVHFHEVGALDAIVDIVGACIGFEILGIEQFVCSKIHVGSGFVNIAHGKFPVPPPAVSELLHGLPIYSTEIVGELMTPTGAAIISTVCGSYGIIPEMIVEQTAYGAGTREYEKFPNVLRLMIGESSQTCSSVSDPARVVTLETNIDDVSPQILGFVMERAFNLGALDCWFTPIQMKKNRPAVMLSVLCPPKKVDELRDMIFKETSTIGIRIRESDRECLDREVVRVNTAFGPIEVKVASLNGRIFNAMPEYDQVKAKALAHEVPFVVVQDAALAALKGHSIVANNRG
ncbi:MAG: nickel pincer cofactor biosynthesis protein LarC [Pyrinomonadaceae bacterium]